MLHSLRRDRRLALWVACAVALALCAALLAAAQTRQVLPLLDICTSTGISTAAAGVGDHTGHVEHGADGAAPHHHADLACVLCLGLSAPPDVLVWDYRPPAPHALRRWWATPSPDAHSATAVVPPPRGPPDSRAA